MTELSPGQAEFGIKGDTVQVTIRCKNHYEAMLLYDKMVVEGKGDTITIKIKIRPESMMEKACTRTQPDNF